MIERIMDEASLAAPAYLVAQMIGYSRAKRCRRALAEATWVGCCLVLGTTSQVFLNWSGGG